MQLLSDYIITRLSKPGKYVILILVANELQDCIPCLDIGLYTCFTLGLIRIQVVESLISCFDYTVITQPSKLCNWWLSG